jgi:tRNA-(ms[2]io[6]A)-hydroxylase
MRQHIDNSDSTGLIDTLIIGAYVEARSCERFATLAPLLDPKLSKFYGNLVKSESRHFEEYLSLARTNARGDIAQRIEFFGAVEKDLVLEQDSDFRFHSGLPSESGPAHLA